MALGKVLERSMAAPSSGGLIDLSYQKPVLTRVFHESSFKLKPLEFSGGPVIRNPHFHCRDTGLIPGQEIKFPHVTQLGQIQIK